MESPALRHFLAVAESGSVTQAAASLGIAQPALSQSISRLEKHLGAKLFVRTRRGASLTPAGQAILEDIRNALFMIDKAERVVHDVTRGSAGQLTIGVVSSSLVHVLPTALRRLRESTPGVSIILSEMNNAQQIQALQSGHIDVGLLHPPVIVGERFRERLLTREPLIAALPANLHTSGKDQISLAEIARHGLVMFPQSHLPAFNARILEAFRVQSLHVHVSQEANRTLTVLACVAAGLGIALLPSWIQDLAFDGVRYCRIENGDCLPSFDLSVVWRGSSTPSLAQRFVEAIHPI